MSNFHVNCAVMALNEGGIIAYPTEAVFGLGCHPEDVYAVTKILRLKNRSIRKGLILIASDTEQLEPYVVYPDDEIKQRVNSTWPGPITWVLPARENTPYWITGYKQTIAVRVSAHPLVQALCQRAGVIVSTSANPEGKSPARSVYRIRSYFGDRIDYILPGVTSGKRLPTEIREATSGQVLRSSN